MPVQMRMAPHVDIPLNSIGTSDGPLYTSMPTTLSIMTKLSKSPAISGGIWMWSTYTVGWQFPRMRIAWPNAPLGVTRTPGTV